MEGSLSCNSAGCNATVAASKRIGNPGHNAGAGVFASGSTTGGSVTTGAFVDYSKNNHSLSLQHTNTPGMGSTLTGAGSINLHKDAVHRVDANAFHSTTKLDNGFKFNNMGGGVNYNHVNGHSAAITASKIPQIGGTTVGLSGTANLWKSPDQMTRLDLNAGSSRTFGGPFDGHKNTSIGLGINRRF